jgi:hypothetical protein
MKRLALPLLLAAGLLAQVASAQTSSSTPVIGYYKIDVPTGKSMWNCAFVTKKEFQGAATSSAPSGGNTEITQTGATWTAGAFNLHYVELLSGSSAGLILDVVSNTASTVTVEGAVAIPAGTSYCIRKHSTVGSIFKTAGLGPFEDEVLIFDDNGLAHKYLFDDTVGSEQMVDAVSFTNKDNDIVYPGQAFVLTIGPAKTLTFGGNEVSYVKTGPTRIPLYQNVSNLVGLMDPVVASNPLVATQPNERHTIGTVGLKESQLDAFQDEIALFGLVNGSFARTGVFYYDDTPPGFIVDGVGNDVGGTVNIPNGTGFLVKPLASDKTYVQPGFHNP